jgi:protease-4
VTGDDDSDARTDWAGLVARRQQVGLARVLGQAQSLMGTQGAQARCLECSVTLGQGEIGADRPIGGLGGMILARLARMVGLAPLG